MMLRVIASGAVLDIIRDKKIFTMNL